MAKIRSSISEEVVSAALGNGAKFIITELTPDGPKPVYDGAGELLTFTDGGAAAKAAFKLSSDTGNKHQPRPVNDDTWREREAARCKAKDYLPLPWEKEKWWTDLKDIHGEHYPHVAIKDGAFVAYTESPEKGAADIQTRLKPGRYLEKHFSGLLNQYVIRDLCAAFAEKYEDNMLQWAATPDEIEEVYVNGPSSCMSKTVGSYKSGKTHPTRVYGAGDLQVVYLKKSGRINARALCWPDKKTYSVIYGDKGRLEPLLTKLGYKYDPPFGAKLLALKVPVPGGDKYHFVVPHIDGVGWVEMRGGQLHVGGRSGSDKNHAIQAGGAVGVSELLGYTCGCCNKDNFTQRSVVNVFYCDAKANNWCTECAKTGAVQCRVTGYWVKSDQMIEIDGGVPMWRRLQSSQGFVCQKTGKVDWLYNRVVMDNGEHWSKSAVVKHGYQCKCGKALASKSNCDEKCRAELALRRKREADIAEKQGWASTSSAIGAVTWQNLGRGG